MSLLKIKHFDYLIAFAGYFIIALIVLASVLLSPGTVGFFHDWVIGPYHEMNKSYANEGLYIWNSQVGHKVYDTAWIFRLSLLSLPYLGGEVLSKGLLILIVTLSGFGAFCLSKRLKLSSYTSFAAGLVYIFSPIIFTRILAGHLYYLIAYFLSPLILESFLKGKEYNKKRYFIIAALFLAFAAIQLQFIIMLFIVLLIFSLVDFKQIKKGMTGIFIIFSLSFLVTLSPILLPNLLVAKTEIPFSPTQLLSYHTLVTASDLTKSFRMLGYEGIPYSYLNLGTSKDLFPSNAGIIPPWIFYLDFLLPVMGFSVLLFRRDKYTIAFTLIAILGLYFMKGLNPPFPGIFSFLFIHGFFIFRELWHVAFLYSFSITFLVAFFIEKLRLLNFKSPLKISLSIAFISVIIFSNGYPLLLGNFAGYLQTYTFPNEYHYLYNKLSSDPNSNVLVLPYINPIRYDGLRLQGIDPFTLDMSTMIFSPTGGGKTSPTDSTSTWLLSSMQENMTHNLGKLLTGFGIKYVILRKEFVSNYPNYVPLGLLPNFREKWYTPLGPLLNSQKDMKIISNTTQYAIYENLNNATKIFAPVTSVGGLTDFNSLVLISNITSLSNVALYPSVSDRDALIFVDDMQETNMSVKDFVPIGRYTGNSDANNGWTDNRISFGFDHLLASRVNEGAFTASGNSEFSFDLPSKYDDKHVEIWMKALSWNHGGPISIRIDGEKHLHSLFSPDRSFRLFKIFEGESAKPYHISIQNIHGRNYVEGLYIKEKGFQLHNGTNKIFLIGIENQKATNLVSDPGFSSIDNQSGLPLYWNDSLKRCKDSFNCRIKFTDGWNDNVSFGLSTKNNTNLTWSAIYGQEINANPREQVQLITHMKLNKWATQSHIVLEGFNETSKNWYQMSYCPPEINGPLEWQEFSCVITIPENTSKMRLLLNAGWSSQPKMEATTWFDEIYLSKLKGDNKSENLAQIKKAVLPEIADSNSSSMIKTHTTTIKEYNKVNPTLWNVRINTSRPTTIAFAEPYDQSWEATVYRDGKKVDVVKSMPLYGSINAFQIKQTGDLYIVLSFVLQYWYEVGLVISGLTFTFCIFYIAYDWIRDRRIKSPRSKASSHT